MNENLHNKSLKELKEVLRHSDNNMSFQRSDLAHKAVNQLVYRMDGYKISNEEKSLLWNMIKMIIDHDGWFEHNTIQFLLRSALKRNDFFSKKQLNQMFEWKCGQRPSAFKETHDIIFSRIESTDGDMF